MLERFTDAARAAIVGAQHEARRAGADSVLPAHLLVAMLAVGHGSAADALGAAGLTLDGARRALVRGGIADDDVELDPATLWSIGIDLDAVRQQVEDSFGPGALDASAAYGRSAGSGTQRRARLGHIPFSRPAKKALELSVREAVALGGGPRGSARGGIRSGHLLLGVLRGNDPVTAHLLSGARVDAGAVRADVLSRLSVEAA